MERRWVRRWSEERGQRGRQGEENEEQGEKGDGVEDKVEWGGSCWCLGIMLFRTEDGVSGRGGSQLKEERRKYPSLPPRSLGWISLRLQNKAVPFPGPMGGELSKASDFHIWICLSLSLSLSLSLHPHPPTRLPLPPPRTKASVGLQSKGRPIK